MVVFYFVRHGESTDNLRPVWAGWEDAPLSNHGMNQARALGASLASTKFTAIHASDLKRAHSTALALADGQTPKLPVDTTPLLREQHFGIAEGKPWSAATTPETILSTKTKQELYAEGVYPVIYARNEKFPYGESLNDLAKRAEDALRACVLPHLVEEQQDASIGIVSHGLCISELIAALVRKDKDRTGAGRDFKGLLNTAWTKVEVHTAGPANAPEEWPPLVVRVTDVNRHEHIDKIKRQKGGIGSAAHDPKQKDIRAFFGGGAAAATDDAVELPEEGRSESNARDEVGRL